MRYFIVPFICFSAGISIAAEKEAYLLSDEFKRKCRHIERYDFLTKESFATSICIPREVEIIDWRRPDTVAFIMKGIKEGTLATYKRLYQFFSLSPIKIHPALPVYTPREFLIGGEVYIEDLVGSYDNQCGFYALDTDRDTAVRTLTSYITESNNGCRYILAAEIARRLLTENTTSITPSEILDVRTFGTYLEFRNQLSENEITLETAIRRLARHCHEKTILINYLQNCIGRAGETLTVESGLEGEISLLSTIDIIAALQGISLKIYVASDPSTPRILSEIRRYSLGEYGLITGLPERRLILTSYTPKSAPEARNHFNILYKKEEYLRLHLSAEK